MDFNHKLQVREEPLPTGDVHQAAPLPRAALRGQRNRRCARLREARAIPFPILYSILNQTYTIPCCTILSYYATVLRYLTYCAPRRTQPSPRTAPKGARRNSSRRAQKLCSETEQTLPSYSPFAAHGCERRTPEYRPNAKSRSYVAPGLNNNPPRSAPNTQPILKKM